MITLITTVTALIIDPLRADIIKKVHMDFITVARITIALVEYRGFTGFQLDHDLCYLCYDWGLRLKLLLPVAMVFASHTRTATIKLIID